MLKGFLQKYKFFLLTAIVGVQLLFIAFLVKNMLSPDVLGATIITPLKEEDLIFPENPKLQNYYESKPNSVQSTQPSWLKDRVAGTQTINATGLNEQYDYTLEKPKDTYRIITLGDSFTFGVFVDTKNNYPEQLEALLNNNFRCSPYTNLDVINLGVGGYDVEYAADRFLSKGIKYSPDLILWLLKVDDFNQIVDQTRQRKKDLRMEMGKTGQLRQSEATGRYYPDAEQATKELLEKYTSEEIIKYQLDRLKNLQQRYQLPIVIFTMSGTSKNSLDHVIQRSEELNQYLTMTPNVYYYNNLTDIYKIEGAYFKDGHPTEKGYSIIATDLFNYLSESKIIPCN